MSRWWTANGLLYPVQKTCEDVNCSLRSAAIDRKNDVSSPEKCIEQAFYELGYRVLLYAGLIRESALDLGH
jgi:hypothetical protein